MGAHTGLPRRPYARLGGAVCTHLARLARDNALWLGRIARDFGDDPHAALLREDSFFARDMYACRWLLSRESKGALPSHTGDTRGRVALQKTLHAMCTVTLCGRFDDENRLQGYGERHVIATAEGLDEPGRAAYRGMFCDGAYHGRGVFEIDRNRFYDHLKGRSACPHPIEFECPGLHTLPGTAHWAGYRLARFSGDWVNGLPHGVGTATYDHKSDPLCATYVGQWRRGDWHGHGRFSSDDVTYCGPNFVAGRPHGDVTLRCAGPLDYLFQGRLRERAPQSGCFTFADGSRLVVHSFVWGRIKATLWTSDTVAYDGEWDEYGNGEAIDPADGRRIRFHDLTRQCTANKIDGAGRLWHGCTNECHSTEILGSLHEQEAYKRQPCGFQKVRYPNGDVLCGRWRYGLDWVTSFAVSRTCSDARFAGVVFRGFVWTHRTVHTPRDEPDEWIFWPHQRSHPQRDLFVAYVRSNLGPWSPAALQAYDDVL